MPYHTQCIYASAGFRYKVFHKNDPDNHMHKWFARADTLLKIDLETIPDKQIIAGIASVVMINIIESLHLPFWLTGQAYHPAQWY